MERLNFANKKIMVICGALIIIGMITCMLPVSVTKLHHLPAFSYLTLILLWAITVRRRVINPDVRYRMLMGCAFMVMLFFLRMCKFSYFPDDDIINEYLWYGYSLPLTAIPLFMFMATLYIEPVRDMRKMRIIESILLIVDAVLVAVVMTNAYHSWVYKITVHPDKEYTHEWFYYVVTAWRALLTVGILIVVFKKCSLSAARRKWYIPAISIAISCSLLTWYYINGGAPKIAGHKLFQLQEALCIPFIIAFESIIQIGMIPANSGYRRLFDHSGINACIYDMNDNPAVVSIDFTKDAIDADHRINREDVPGGYVTWVDDLTIINRLNREIEEVTEELSGENDLIRQENEIRAERVSFETKNRLYNRIATAVRTRAVRVNGLLIRLSGETDENNFRKGIVYASILSAYIKRMGNLMLLTDGGRNLSSEELKIAIAESMEYLRISGCVCDISVAGSCELPADFALLSYELFEAAVEDVRLTMHTITVSLDCLDPFELLIAMDAKPQTLTSSWKEKEVAAASGELTVKYEDDTLYVSFRKDGFKNPDAGEVGP